MPGPLPKDPGLRQRRNRSATAATLTLAASGVEAPELPELYRLDEETGEYVVVPWHPRTLAWWRDVWASPMAAEFLEADHHGLFLLAELEDRFHKADSTHGKLELAKEIRLQRAMFGLTPMDRRRLQWEVERSEEAADKGRRRRRSVAEDAADEASRASASADPRRLLSAVDS